MQLSDNNGLEISLTYDEDGFPSIRIDTGGGFYNENHRPTVEVLLNDVVIHEMFDHEDDADMRWEDPPS